MENLFVEFNKSKNNFMIIIFIYKHHILQIFLGCYIKSILICFFRLTKQQYFFVVQKKPLNHICNEIVIKRFIFSIAMVKCLIIKIYDNLYSNNKYDINKI